MSKAKRILYHLRYVVNKYIPFVATQRHVVVGMSGRVKNRFDTRVRLAGRLAAISRQQSYSL
jgi:hypothetical protein